jgi:hypothetical protein
MVQLTEGPGVYALLPPGWYYFTMKYHYDNVSDPVEEVQLAVCHSEIDQKFHKELCLHWSKHNDDWDDLTNWFINWEEEHKDKPVTIQEAAGCLLLLDHEIRRLFGEEVFSQRNFKPWGGRGVVNIDEQNEYYVQNNMKNPYVYKTLIKLPPGFDVNRIEYFCEIRVID